MSDNFFENLKNSPLADATSSSSIEAIAIWLNMNILKCNDLIRTFKSIEKHYHDNADLLIDPQTNAFRKMAINSLNGSSFSNSLSNSFLIAPNFSDRALQWLFKVIDHTDAIDSFVLSKKFMSYAKDRKEHYQYRIKQAIIKTKYHIPSIYGNLYEIFAELVDLLEDKLTKKSQSLPS